MDLKKHMDDTESIYNNTNVGLDPSQNALKGMKVKSNRNLLICVTILLPQYNYYAYINEF